jgi:hypothetical protein
MDASEVKVPERLDHLPLPGSLEEGSIEAVVGAWGQMAFPELYPGKFLGRERDGLVVKVQPRHVQAVLPESLA